MRTAAHIKEYIGEGKTMQLATTRGNQPWACSVYYVHDSKLNIYWLSLPDRRHSREIAKNTKVAITITVKTDIPVIGITAEGNAQVVNDPVEVKRVMKRYIDKYNTGHDFYKNFKLGKNKHVMYCFVPKKYVLFDEVNFPDDPRKSL